MEKTVCNQVFAAEAASGAAKLCGIGECICEYDCGHSNRTGHKNCRKPLIGQHSCPLARYGVQPEQNPKPWYARPFQETNPSEDELFALCACCDNSIVAELQDGYELERIDIHKCLGCPVKMTEDAVAECAAEGACS